MRAIRDHQCAHQTNTRLVTPNQQEALHTKPTGGSSHSTHVRFFILKDASAASLRAQTRQSSRQTGAQRPSARPSCRSAFRSGVTHSGVTHPHCLLHMHRKCPAPSTPFNTQARMDAATRAQLCDGGRSMLSMLSRHCACSGGDCTTPVNTGVLVARCWMANTNGRSNTSLNGGCCMGMERVIITAVAAAATVPSSSTSTTALWSTCEMNSGGSEMRLKSAPLAKASVMPSDCSTCFSSELDSERNFGSSTMVLSGLWAFA
mmetsp:Transcript_14365/g.41890  ORF Transcript_14365/g.41890 Transcript_14365/m.41890 type:complete len:261 (+) Transcript_14365:168-950(+)